MKRKERGAMLFHFTPYAGCKWKESTCSCSHWLVLTLVYAYLQPIETSSLNTQTHTELICCCIVKTEAGFRGKKRQHMSDSGLMDSLSCLCSTRLFFESVSSLCHPSPGCDRVRREGGRRREEEVTGQ